MKIASVVLSLTVLLEVGACSTTGTVTTSEITAPPIVQAPGVVNPEVAGYVERLFSPLAARGFQLGSTADRDALRFIVLFNPNVFNTQVTVKLRQHGATVLQVQASNAGWGTGIARPAAISNLVESAVAKFDEELKKIHVATSAGSGLDKVGAGAHSLTELLDRISANCIHRFADPSVEPLARKMAINRRPSLAELVNQAVISEKERPMLLKYSEIADDCNDQIRRAHIAYGTPPALMTVWDAQRNATTRNLVDLYERKVNFGEYLQRKVDLADKFQHDIAAVQQELGRQEADARERAQELAAQRAMAYAAVLSATSPAPQPVVTPAPIVVPSPPLSIHTTCNHIGQFTYCNTY